MREILFRGKRLGDGEWVEGYLTYRYRYDQQAGKEILGSVMDVLQSTTVGKVTGKVIGSYNVDTSTVGQYTGLKDKNGKRIFEGDVVEGHCHSAWSHDLQRCEVAYGRDGFEARHHVNCGEDGWRYYTYRVLFSKDVVVIGNIHDNPELVKDGEG